MRDAGRLAAAIEVLGEVCERHKPVRLALKAWGEGARYAGAKDRAWVSGLVLDALRRRRSLAWRLGSDGPRAWAIGALRWTWDWPLERIAEACAETPHGPGALTGAEAAGLAEPRDLDDAPMPVQGDYPDWLDVPLERAFAGRRALYGADQAVRAPVGLRVNTLKTDVERAMKALAPLDVEPAGVLRCALRIKPPAAAERAPAIEVFPEFEKGWFEVQDLGSQIAAAAAGDVKGAQVLDLCAGGGGKTLALAAAMANTGQLYAYDADARRLTDTVRRAARAGVRNLQVRSPVRPGALAGLEGKMDVVFVDAPCTGSGTWRRHPDAKWRLTPAQLERRQNEQDTVLAQAVGFVKPGGRIVYVTCSFLKEENEDRVAAFLADHPGFVVADLLQQLDESGLLADDGGYLLKHCVTTDGFLRLSPRRAGLGADGFFVAVLRAST